MKNGLGEIIPMAYGVFTENQLQIMDNMNKNKIKAWLARDKDGTLWLYPSIPFRDSDTRLCDVPIAKLDGSYFPFVKWEDDEPAEAYISFAKPQEEKEIDWEQRCYEIARDLLTSICANAELLHYNELAYAQEAVELADVLIKELKKEKHNTTDTGEE